MKWIDNFILGLIDTYGTNDVYELFDYLGIKIKKLSKNNVLLRNNEAFYYRNTVFGEIVFLRQNLSSNFEKFILAHELAHAIIHTDLTQAPFNAKLINKGKLELQANYFALKLICRNLDSTELNEMTLEQIASCLELPYAPIRQVVSI